MMWLPNATGQAAPSYTGQREFRKSTMSLPGLPGGPWGRTRVIRCRSMEGAFSYSTVLQQVGGGPATGIVSGTVPEIRAAYQAKNAQRTTTRPIFWARAASAAGGVRGVQGVAEAVAQQVEGQHGDENRQAREHDQVRVEFQRGPGQQGQLERPDRSASRGTHSGLEGAASTGGLGV